MGPEKRFAHLHAAHCTRPLRIWHQYFKLFFLFKANDLEPAHSEKIAAFGIASPCPDLHGSFPNRGQSSATKCETTFGAEQSPYVPALIRLIKWLVMKLANEGRNKRTDKPPAHPPTPPLSHPTKHLIDGPGAILCSSVTLSLMVGRNKLSRLKSSTNGRSHQ